MTSSSFSSSALFEAQLKQWVLLDNQLKELNERTKEAREKRKKLEESLTTYASTNNLSNNTIKIAGDTKLKFATTQVAEPLTFKYLEKALSQVIRNPTQVKQIVDHVKQNREIKTVPEIKRYVAK